ncbi:unnamed protein product, partial [Iphiclides podalirius]
MVYPRATLVPQSPPPEVLVPALAPKVNTWAKPLMVQRPIPSRTQPPHPATPAPSSQTGHQSGIDSDISLVCDLTEVWMD